MISLIIYVFLFLEVINVVFSDSLLESSELSTKFHALINQYFSDGDQMTIPKDLWQGPDLYKFDNGEKVPQMAANSCKGLFLAGYAMSINSGVAVEFGSWVGQSSSCLAAGMKSAGLIGKLHCFDIYDKKRGKDKLDIKYQNMESVDVFHMLVDRIDTTVNIHKGYIGVKEISGSQTWNNQNVGIFAIDSAKTYHHTIVQTEHGIWNLLQPGSIIFLMDFSKVIHQVMIFYSQYVLNGDLQVEYIAFETSPWAFSIHKKLDRNKLLKWKEWLYRTDIDVDLILIETRKKILSDIEIMASRQKVSESSLNNTKKYLMKVVDTCINNKKKCYDNSKLPKDK